MHTILISIYLYVVITYQALLLNFYYVDLIDLRENRINFQTKCIF